MTSAEMWGSAGGKEPCAPDSISAEPTHSKLWATLLRNLPILFTSRARRRSAAENVGNQIHCIRDVDSAITVSVARERWFWRGSSREDVGDKIDGVGDIDAAI